MSKTAWDFAADFLDPPDARFKAQRHQLPPPGLWFGWMFLGGRGTGKTATDSKYVHDHVNGPPCDPNLPGGHWVGIVAPTKDDAVTSCVNGPSGLKMHDPDLKLRVGAGGTMVKWSNGAEGKLFGASTPEDVERLRSGGNRCYARDTLILTEHGWLPIQRVTTERVATRQGWSRIDRSGYTGHAEIYNVELSDGGVLRVTDDHQHLLTDGSRKSTLALVAGDNLVPWERETFVGITRSGQKPTAPSRQVTRSTTKITTKQMMRSRISSCSPQHSTGRNITASVDPIGTPRVAEQAGWLARSEQLPALAGRHSTPRSTRQSSALKPVGLRPSGTNAPAPSGSKASVRTVASPTGTYESTRTHVSVVRCVATGVHEATYCVRVPDLHEVVVWTGASAVVSGNCLYWFEEMAAWRYLNECYQHARYGLRLGPRPHWVASTTPKPHLLIQYLSYVDKINRGTTLTKAENQKFVEICQKLGFPVQTEPAPERQQILLTKATTEDNKHLPAHVKDMLYQDFGGTRTGRQELYAEILEDVQGALWQSLYIDLWRLGVADTPDVFNKIVVGVDPNAKAHGDECGIVVAGRIARYNGFGKALQFPELPHGFVLEDASISGGPPVWAQRVIRAFDDWKANAVVAEVNNGGDMVKHTLHTYRPSLPVIEVHASRGKAKRAEPVANLSQQGRIHHVGIFPKLEDQMTTWNADDPPDDWSPDRMDAFVWAMTDLLVGRTQTTQTTVRDTRMRHRR